MTLNYEKPYKIDKILSSKWDKYYNVCRYETFDTCDCKAFEVKDTCKHLKLWNETINL